MQNKRVEKLIEYIHDESLKELLKPSIQKYIYLEEQLQQIEKLPFFKVDKNDKTKQKELPSLKAHKNLMNSYINLGRLLASYFYKEDSEQNDIKKLLELFNEFKEN